MCKKEIHRSRKVLLTWLQFRAILIVLLDANKYPIFMAQLLFYATKSAIFAKCRGLTDSIFRGCGQTKEEFACPLASSATFHVMLV